MTKEETNNMSTKDVQQDSTTSTSKMFVPYSVNEDVVNQSKEQIFRAEIIELLSQNPNKWFCVDESFFSKEDRAQILSKRSVYYTAAKQIQRKFGNIEYRVKGGMTDVAHQMANGFDYQSQRHAVRLYARWTA